MRSTTGTAQDEGDGMAARLTLPRTAAWVWHAEPRSIFGLEAVFVRCASGTSAVGRGGFPFADNYRAWVAARGPAVVPWTWFGPPASSDGSACADALHAVAPGQRMYVVEVGAETPPDQVTAFAARLRQWEPIAALGFSTWPTRAEAEAAGVPWDACVDAFDFGLPQVYTSYQRELLLRTDSPVVADMLGKPIHVAVFPDADARWTDSARLAVDEHAGVSAWAVDQSSFTSWRRQLGALGEGRLGLPSPPPAEPPARPAEREAPEAPAPPPGRADAHETLTPVHFDEPGEQTLLANRILAVVQARLDAGGKLTDDELVADIEHVLRDR
jgi:hypothetical protein